MAKQRIIAITGALRSVRNKKVSLQLSPGDGVILLRTRQGQT